MSNQPHGTGGAAATGQMAAGFFKESMQPLLRILWRECVVEVPIRELATEAFGDKRTEDAQRQRMIGATTGCLKYFLARTAHPESGEKVTCSIVIKALKLKLSPGFGHGNPRDRCPIQRRRQRTRREYHSRTPADIRRGAEEFVETRKCSAPIRACPPARETTLDAIENEEHALILKVFHE